MSKPEVVCFLSSINFFGVIRRGDFQLLRLTVKKRMCATLLAIHGKLNRQHHDLGWL